MKSLWIPVSGIFVLRPSTRLQQWEVTVFRRTDPTLQSFAKYACMTRYSTQSYPAFVPCITLPPTLRENPRTLSCQEGHVETHKDGNFDFSSGDEMRQHGDIQGRQVGAQ